MLGLVTTASVIFLTTLLSRFILNTVHFVVKSRRHLNHILKLPGRPSPHAFWGHMYQFPGTGEDGFQFLLELIKKEDIPLSQVQYGPIFGAVSLTRHDSVKQILKTSEPKPRHFGGYRFLLPWLGDGLLISEGKKWARNRRLLTPAFHFDILKPYILVNNQCADIFLKKINKFEEAGEYFEVFQHVSLLTFDIISKCAFSYDIDSQTIGYQHPYVQAAKELGESMAYRMIRPQLYIDWIYNLTPTGRRYKKNCDFVHRVADDIIQKRKKDLSEHGDSILRHHKYIDFLDILLKAKDTDGEGLSDLDIRNEVDTFLFEGHDTTASGISWTLYSLAKHPDIQSKCQKEIDAVLQGRDNDYIEWDDLGKLPYLTMCIKESLRHHTTVPVIQRITTKDMNIQGYDIPKNTIVEINLYLLHHNPYIWDEPLEYRPERFSPENMEKLDPYQYVPFSAGPRNCIGQHFAMHEMKVVVSRILRRFTLELDPTREVRHELAPVMKTENGMYMKVLPRDI